MTQEKQVELQEEEGRLEKKRRAFRMFVTGTLAIIAGILLLFWDSIRYYFMPAEPLGVVETGALKIIPADRLEENDLYITDDRREYQGGMYLRIPVIDIYTQVGTSTEPPVLEEMPGLYEFSQMPAESMGNLSIAGHRDIYNMEFRWLNKVGEGDFLYILYGGYIYSYVFHGKKVVKADDWSVIERQGFTCLTLTTCDPVGTSLNRLIVTAEFNDVQPYSEEYVFLSNVSEMDDD